MDLVQSSFDFDPMLYQVQAFSELAHIVQSKTIPNALLFQGHENTGRKSAAFALAKGCNCRNGSSLGCTACPACRKIDRRCHPDMICVEPPEGKKIISIAQVRELGALIASRPNEAEYRMILILQAETMNTQAQNALLKMLEEPPGHTFFVLTADQTDRLLPTILSRCRKIRFKPLTAGQVADYLVRQHSADPKLARIVSETLGPDIRKALACLGMDPETPDSRWLEKRHRLLGYLLEMIQNSPHSILKALMLAREISLDPEAVREVLSIMRSFFRDMMIFPFHPDKIINLDFSHAFSDIGSRIPLDRCVEWLTRIHDTEQKIQANCSPRLTLDSFFISMAEYPRDATV